MTYEAFVTTLRIICIANEVDLRISGSDYYLICGDREIQVSKGWDSFSNDIVIVLKHIDIVSCPYRYAYDSVDRNLARIRVPLSDFKNTSDAQYLSRWIVNTVLNKESAVVGIFRRLINFVKGLI